MAKQKSRDEKPLTLWQRAWKAIMENLELDGQADPYDSPEDEDGAESSDDQQPTQNGGPPLNKRERKLLKKETSYSDVI